MGTKIVVGTQIMRVIKDEQLPNAIKTGTTKAILRNGDLPEYILEELVQSAGFKAEQLYEYAEKGHYIHGMPTAFMRSNSQGWSKVQAALGNLEGRPVSLEYSRVGAANFLHLAWMDMVSRYQYEASTNELKVLSTAEGVPVYLQDIQVCVPADRMNEYKTGVLEIVGFPPNAGYSPDRVNAFSNSTAASSLRKPTPVYADKNALTEYLKISTCRVYTTTKTIAGVTYYPGQPVVNSFTLPMPEVDDPDKDYIQAKYVSNGVTKWWLYQMGSDTQPTLEDIDITGPEISGRFFPFSYFRYEKISEIENKETESYKSVKAMVQKLGMNYDEVADSINSNPDIKDVIQAYLMFGVPADSTDQTDLRYLYDFFEQLYSQQGAQFSSTGPNATDAIRKIIQPDIISDGRNMVNLDIADNRFRMNFSATGIFKKTFGGVIGKKGEYASYTGREKYSYPYVDSETNTQQVNTVWLPYHVYQHQVTEEFYSEILVYELEMLYYIYGTKYTTSDTTKNILLVPLDKSITEKYSVAHRELVYSRAMHFVFNSMQMIKVKWYQTGLFSFLLVAVAIAITVISYGSGGSALAASIAAGTASLQAVAMALLQTMFISWGVGEAVKLFAKAVGGDLAMIVAAVVAVYMTYRAIELGSIKGIPFAKELLSVASNLVQAGMEVKMNGLQNEYSVFREMTEAKNKELELAQDLLTQNTYLSPLTIFGESPTDFYNRTVHSGNVGVVGIGAISSYVDNALTLPKLNDTLGDYSYGNS